MDQLARLASSKPREENFVVLDCSQDLVRAILGIQETLRRPTVEVASRVGLRRPRAAHAPTRDEYLVGTALDEAERAGESLEIIWPLVVGDAGKGKEREVDGVRDWTGFEALLAYVLFTALALPARPLAYHLHLALPPNFALSTHEDITQMCFERLHLPALILSERPLLSLFGVNTLAGLIIDVGRASTEISIVYDSLVSAASSGRTYVGRDDCDNYLCHLLLAAQPDLPSKLSPSTALAPEQLYQTLLSIVSVLRRGNHLHFASAALSLNTAADGSRLEDEAEVEVDDAVLDDVAKALVSGQAAALLGRTNLGAGRSNVTTSGEHLTMPNPLNPATTITIGPERHRFAEPLFDPSLLGKITGFGVAYDRLDLDQRAVSLPEAVASSVRTMDIKERLAIWDHVVVQGVGVAKGLSSAIMQALAGYVGVYAAKPKLARVPDYFPEFRDRLDLATFLGASIVAKIGFLDSSGQHWVNKQDYSTRGPGLVSHIETVQ